ncbi:hypothetical protein ECBCE008MS13_3025 [Escherichia coli BCE008_MS-13]|nr:hypothetical protein ECBCE008MS13_3025 [Escherichia coli BCE008_MS-13]
MSNEQPGKVRKQLFAGDIFAQQFIGQIQTEPDLGVGIFCRVSKLREVAAKITYRWQTLIL